MIYFVMGLLIGFLCGRIKTRKRKVLPLFMARRINENEPV